MKTARERLGGRLAVYVTSHGFGHLNRTAAVLNQVPAEVPVTIRSHSNLFEHWRERLISQGAPALAELQRWRPDIDSEEWAARVHAAQAERGRAGVSGAAAKELFRALRALFATMP